MAFGVPGPRKWRRLARNFGNYVNIHSWVIFRRTRKVYQLRRVFLSWFRRLVAGFLPQASGFDPRPVRIRCAVDEVVLGQVFLPLLLFSPANTIPTLVHTNSSCYRNFMGHSSRHGLIKKIRSPWNRVLRGKLLVPHQVNKFPASYGTRKFITVTKEYCVLYIQSNTTIFTY